MNEELSVILRLALFFVISCLFFIVDKQPKTTYNISEEK